MYAHACMHMHVCICMYAHACMHMHVCTCMYAHMEDADRALHFSTWCLWTYLLHNLAKAAYHLHNLIREKGSASAPLW